MKELSHFPIGASNDAYAQYFIGKSYLHVLSGMGCSFITSSKAKLQNSS